MRPIVPMLILSLAALGGCTWVPMAPGASEVKVVAAGAAPSGCEKRGEAEVSVKDRLAFFDRNDLRVREELETLARNEAHTVQADTIQPQGDPLQGAQRFLLWRCVGARATTPSSGTAETFPAR